MEGKGTTTLFNDSVTAVGSITMASFFTEFVNNTSKRDIIQSLQTGENRKRQVGNLAIDIQNNSLTYDGDYPSAEALFTMAKGDFTQMLTILNKKNGWEKLIKYYNNQLTGGEIGKIDGSIDWQAIEEFFTNLPSTNTANSDYAEAIKCMLYFKHMGNDSELHKYLRNLFAFDKYRFDPLIITKSLDIPELLPSLINKKYFHSFDSMRQELILKTYKNDPAFHAKVMEFVSILKESFAGTNHGNIKGEDALKLWSNENLFLGKFLEIYGNFVQKHFSFRQ